ncbi:MAG: hypothetical protein ABS911_12580 [Carnobacterium sp.]|uniref:hypothetical protein n=1 Tax=Carnobacterium sp. TaxID=48221 RepID=UPI003315F10B
MEVAIYFDNGNTAYFHKVKDFNEQLDVDGRSTISFDYFGIASQQHKHAQFNKKNIAGYAITKGFKKD